LAVQFRYGGAGGVTATIRLPRTPVSPIVAFLRRIGYAVAVLLLMFAIVLFDRSGYTDNADGEVSVLDAFYYTTVSISTTGYGDIAPVSDTARFITAIVITPLRVLFLGILVSTAFEVLTERTRDEIRVHRWEAKTRMHTVVIGYGTKGRNAIKTLRANGEPPESFIVVDRNAQLIAEANAAGIAGIVGDATRSSVLRQAKAHEAKYVVIAPDRDDTAVLITLTTRQLNPDAIIAVAVRESENEPLLLQSGATAVITSAAAAGRLLGFAALSPVISQVFSDLLVHGKGLEIVQRQVRPDEVGEAPADTSDQIIAVVRDGKPVPFDSGVALSPGDLVVVVRSRPDEMPQVQA
jgi:voltage-gated potassium channel